MQIFNDGHVYSQLKNGGNKFLYHFTSIDKLYKILLLKKLRMNSIYKSNDPFEHKARIFEIQDSEKVEFNEYVLSNNEIEYTNKKIYFNGIDIFAKKTSFLSFCQDEIKIDKFTWSVFKPRMWSQYGENHKGACLVFNKDEFIEIIKTQLPIPLGTENKEQYCNIKDLKYETTVMKFVITKADFEKEGYLGWIKHWSESIYLQKNYDYSQEVECRLVYFDCNKKENTDSIFLDYKSSLKAIVFGCEADDIIFNQLVEMYSDTKIGKVIFDDGIPAVRWL